MLIFFFTILILIKQTIIRDLIEIYFLLNDGCPLLLFSKGNLSLI